MFYPVCPQPGGAAVPTIVEEATAAEVARDIIIDIVNVAYRLQ
jgi:hypothetical protein